jgi:hypothetical protein
LVGRLQAKVFEAVELSDGSVRVVMEIGEAKAGVAKVAVDRDVVQVTVWAGRRVLWEGIFHLPFKASKETVSCQLKNSFLELVAGPAGAVLPTAAKRA